MIGQPLTPATLEIFKRRLTAIESESQRKWGKLTPAGLMRHLRFVVEMSLGEIEVKDGSNFLNRNVLLPVFFKLPIPWPRGIKAPPTLTPRPEADLAEERAKLLAGLDRFTAALAADPNRVGTHMLFGPQPFSMWSRMHGRHYEHHFIQFGV